MKPLNRTQIGTLAERPLRVLQFGGGNFLRAFADWMIDILNEETAFNGDVLLVKPTSRGSYESLRQQDGLYHVVLQGWQGKKAISQTRMIRCVKAIINPYEEWEDYLETAKIPSLRFVISNTTESGIRYDASASAEGQPPGSFPAKLTRWLFHRFLHFGGDGRNGCVFLPCELIEANGDTLRDCILKHGEEWSLGKDFQDWIYSENYFCNTLVDRIVSGFPANTADSIHRETGFHDQQLVVGELYHSWVIEGPEELRTWLPFKETSLNVQFVPDLRPFRDMKVYLLNASHTLMVPLGLMLGLRLVRECMENTLLRRYLDTLMEEEICPTFDWPRKTILAYKDSVTDRFMNPFVDHQLRSIALNSLSKVRTRVVPIISAYYQKTQRLPQRTVFAFAALLWLYNNDSGSVQLEINDSASLVDILQVAWSHYSGTTQTANMVAGLVLQSHILWNEDLTRMGGLKELLGNYLFQIGDKGVRQAMIHL